MSGLSDIRLQARGDLHQMMAVPALYIPAPDAEPIPCTVRRWLKSDALTNAEGVTGGVDLANPEDRLRFDLSDFGAPLRNRAIVSIASGEAYRIEYLYPLDRGYQTARVTRLAADEADGLPLPEAA